jgi:DNA-binding protein H-NS
MESVITFLGGFMLGALSMYLPLHKKLSNERDKNEKELIQSINDKKAVISELQNYVKLQSRTRQQIDKLTKLTQEEETPKPRKKPRKRKPKKTSSTM